MKNLLKVPGNKYEIYNEILKNPLKAPGKTYEIYNEIPKLNE
jgi:hypothetical protein